MLAEAGEVDEARQVAYAALERGSHTERDHVWWGTVGVLAETAVHLRDTEMAAALLPEVEPFSDHITVIGLGTGSLGVAARVVAQMEWMTGRYEEADRHFTQAHEVNERSARGASRCAASMTMRRCCSSATHPGDGGPRRRDDRRPGRAGGRARDGAVRRAGRGLSARLAA